MHCWMAANRGQWRKDAPISVNKQRTQTDRDRVYVRRRPKQLRRFSSDTGRDDVETRRFYKKQRRHDKDRTPLCFRDGKNSTGGFYGCQQLHNKRVLLHGHKTVWRSHDKTLSAVKKKPDASLTGILIKRPLAVGLTQPGGTMRRKHSQSLLLDSCITLEIHPAATN